MNRAARLGTAILVVGAALPILPGPLLASPSQEPTVSELSRRITKQKDGVDPALFERLARIGGKRSFEALKKAFRSLDDSELRSAAYQAFRFYVDDPALAPTSVAFLADEARKARRDDSRQAALRALLHFDGAALAELETIARTHRDRACRRIATDALVPLLASRGDLDSLRTILSSASLAQEKGLTYVGIDAARREILADMTHRAVVRDVLSRLAGPERRAVLLEHLVARDTGRVWKLLILRLVRDIDSEQVRSALAAACRDEDPVVVLLAMDFIVEHYEWQERADVLRPLLSSDEPALRRRALVALGQVLATEPSFRAELLVHVRSKDPALRMGAAGALVEVRTPEATRALHTLLEDPNWSVRVEALQRVAQGRAPESIPVVIERLAAETGRLARDAHGVLVILTGMDLGRLPQPWRLWWEREGQSFQMPSADHVQGVREQARAAPQSGTAARSFYSLEVHSERVIFVLDVSGSMRELARDVVGKVEVSRMDMAKEQLASVVRTLPEGTLFNLVFFGSEVRSLDGKLIRMKKATRQKALRFVRDQSAVGATALYPALQLAFADPLVDTLYVVSDGAPTVGELTDIEEIRAEVARWNSARHVKIHGVSMGQDSTLLRWLCGDTGGRYQRVD